MSAGAVGKFRTFLIWATLATVLIAPVAAAAFSPLLAWRQPVYILAGFAGVIAMALLLVQPLLAGRFLPGLSPALSRRFHTLAGCSLVIAILLHVGGLWVTSPPDVIDVLLFRSPTPFSIWGVVAMWAIFAAAILAAIRRQLRIPAPIWRFAHVSLAFICVAGSVVHAMLIEGTMELVTKTALCASLLAATVWLIVDLKTRYRRRHFRS